MWQERAKNRRGPRGVLASYWLKLSSSAKLPSYQAALDMVRMRAALRRA